ncbi:hypothetical protein F5Y16DRAFT_405407 [Xylariaceae sp. FL0255]|nr:hypothetical protein F5Y16DRAFT_405407 [Xylariaceae sp. FL0255]
MSVAGSLASKLSIAFVAAPVFLFGVSIVFVAALLIHNSMNRLCYRNRLDYENMKVTLARQNNVKGPWTLVFRNPVANGVLFQEKSFNTNPWDLGTRENLRQTLGNKRWQWPIFWIKPQRVKKYGRLCTCDLPFSEEVSDAQRQLYGLHPFGVTRVSSFANQDLTAARQRPDQPCWGMSRRRGTSQQQAYDVLADQESMV